MLGPFIPCFLPVCTPFFFDSIVEWILGILRRIEIFVDLFRLVSCFCWWQVQQVAHGVNGVSFVVLRMTLITSFSTCPASVGWTVTEL